MSGLAEFFEKIVRQINEFWNRQEKAARIRMIVLAALLLVVIIVCLVMFTRVEYDVLYSGLADDEAGEVIERLDALAVPSRVEKGGTILVPAERVERVRWQLTSEGYPQSGLNYDLFAQSTGFGTTDYEKRQYYQFQLQERLANTLIKAVDGVESAIVNITLSDDSSYVLAADKKPSTAGVTLRLRQGFSLTSAQVQTIVDLITVSVPDLSPENVTVMDNNANRLNVTKEDDYTTIGTHLETQERVKDALRRQVLNLLTPVYGSGNVVPEVAVTMDFDKKVSESVTFSPVVDDEGIAVSLQELTEQATGASTSTVAGQDANGGAPTYPENDGTGSTYSKITKDVNYEVNQIKDMIERAQGTVTDLSVSVVVNSAMVTEDEMIDQTQELVAGALGVAPSKVVVRSMALSGSDQQTKAYESYLDEQRRLQNMELIKSLSLYGLVAIIILLLLVLLFRTLRPRKEPAPVFDQGPDGELDDLAALAALAQQTPGKEEPEPAPITARRSMEREKIEDFINKNPDAVAGLIRNWLNEDARGGRK